MAIVLQFKQGDSGTTLSLNSASAGFSLAGWSPSVATPVHMGDPAPIGESIHLRLKQANQNTLATSMQSLHEMQVLADRYINDPTQETPVWLHAKMANETGERRALVYSISVQYKSSWFGPEATAEDIPLVLNVVRGPYWENTTARNLPDAAPSAAACVVYDYTAAGDAVGAHDIVGDAGARLRFLELINASKDLNTFWMGIRSADKHGATGVTNFAPVWELEDGTNQTDAADVEDAWASDGYNVTVTESGVDWDDGSFHDVCGTSVSIAASGNEADQMGNFLWLLRGHATGDDVWEVRLVFFLGRTDNIIYKDIIEISNSDWLYHEMAISPISLYNFQTILDADYDTDNIGDTFVMIEARRTTDSAGTLKLDCLCLIPVDEGFCKITTPGFALTVSDMFGQSPKGEVEVLRRDYTDDAVLGWGTIDSIENFILPPGDGRIFCVYSGNPDVLADTMTFNDGDTGKYYERWLSLRGSE